MLLAIASFLARSANSLLFCPSHRIKIESLSSTVFTRGGGRNSFFLKPEDEQRYQGDELEDQASQGAKESRRGVGGTCLCALLTKIPQRDPEHCLGKSREL